MSLHIHIAPRQIPVQPPPKPAVIDVRVVWDDENPDWNFKCRTQHPGFVGPKVPPAVNRFAREILKPGQPIGDYRVNISKWFNFFVRLNNDATLQDFNYWTDPTKAQFNQTGWPMLAHLVFSGNQLRGVYVGDWFKFMTLRAADPAAAEDITLNSHPWFIHRFTCVKWDGKKTVKINSTGTPRGDIFTPVITESGFGYIPKHVVVPL